MRKWLLHLRKCSGFTMKCMGVQLGIAENSYCNIENGERQKKMDIAFAKKIAEIFDITLDDIADLESGVKFVCPICGTCVDVGKTECPICRISFPEEGIL